MSPRPRLSSDAEVLAAATRVILRLGPARLTLADVGKEAGLAPATLLQRFGSKRGLLLAVARRAAESSDQCFASVRRKHLSPLQAVYASFEEMTRNIDSPGTVANSLAFLQLDLADPEFRALADQSGRAIVNGFQQLLNEAIERGELGACDSPRLARALCAASHGSMMSWAIHREGPLPDWLREDLETLLAPYLTSNLGRGGDRTKQGKRARK